MIASYLQTAVNVYKVEGKLPDWVIYFRKILDRLDEPCDGTEFTAKKDSDEGKPEAYNFFSDLKEEEKPASMSFLQIKPFQENGQMYDFRDEHEYKMSKNPKADLQEKYNGDVDIDFINIMNSSRENEGKLFNDLSQVEEDLYENDKENDGYFSKDTNDFSENKTGKTMDDLNAKVKEIVPNESDKK